MRVAHGTSKAATPPPALPSSRLGPNKGAPELPAAGTTVAATVAQVFTALRATAKLATHTAESDGQTLADTVEATATSALLLVPCTASVPAAAPDRQALQTAMLDALPALCTLCAVRRSSSPVVLQLILDLLQMRLSVSDWLPVMQQYVQLQQMLNDAAQRATQYAATMAKAAAAGSTQQQV